MNNYKPSLLVSNVFDPISRDETKIMDLYESIANLNFYKSLEIRVIQSPSIRKAFSDLSKVHKWNITYWLTSNLNDSGFSLSNTLEFERIAAVEYTKRLIDMCVEGNASYIGICSGKRVHHSEDEFLAFKMSCIELLHYISNIDSIKLLFEPLDAYADKKFVVGDMHCVKRLYNELIKSSVNIHQFILCIDTAHIALNKDDLFQYMTEFGQYSNRIHFANAILDPNNLNFGDKHLPFNNEGFLDNQMIKALFDYSKRIHFFCEEVFLTCEIRSKSFDEMEQTEQFGRELLLELLK